MIGLSNGRTFEYLAASGALAFKGQGWWWEQPLRWAGLLEPELFTIVTKTFTLLPLTGNYRWWNPLRCARFLTGGGMVNVVALSNPGIFYAASEVFSRMGDGLPRMIVSITGTIEELKKVASVVVAYEGRVLGIEFNASCPNTPEEGFRNAAAVVEGCEVVHRRARGIPLLLKLSVQHRPHLREIADGVKDIVEAININSVPWRLVFGDRPSPLRHLHPGGGGVSGKIAQRWTWEFLEELVAVTRIPVVGPSIWDFGDMEEVRKRGARAIAFGSIFGRYPWRPTQFVRRDQEERIRIMKQPCSCGDEERW